MLIRSYQYNGTPVTNVLFDNTGDALFDNIVGIKIPTSVMNINNAKIRTTVLITPVEQPLKTTTNYTDTSTWNVLHLVCMGVYDTNTQTLYIAFVPNTNTNESIEIKIELLPNASVSNYSIIATGTFNTVKIFGTGNRINAINRNFKLSGDDFKKKSIIVGTGCADTSLLTKYSDNNFVNLSNIVYKAPTLTLIYSITNRSQVANTYSLVNLSTQLITTKPFKIEAYVQYPSDINTQKHNGIWRSIALYSTEETNPSTNAGHIQLRLHNNSNANPAQKSAYLGFDGISPTPENNASNILTIAQSSTGLYYCLESTDGKTCKITIGDKVMNYTTYTKRTFNKVLFGRPDSASYENVGGTMIIKSLKIYN